MPAKSHGQSSAATRTKEYRVWAHMRGRCLNRNDAAYKYYGARGITVSPKWNTFEAFLADVGKAPTAKHTLDRIDNNGGYEPGNVRWACMSVQNRNTRKNVMYEGKCLSDACKEMGVSYEAVQARIRRGMPIASAITIPLRDRRSIKRAMVGAATDE